MFVFPNKSVEEGNFREFETARCDENEMSCHAKPPSSEFEGWHLRAGNSAGNANRTGYSEENAFKIWPGSLRREEFRSVSSAFRWVTRRSMGI